MSAPIADAPAPSTATSSLTPTSLLCGIAFPPGLGMLPVGLPIPPTSVPPIPVLPSMPSMPLGLDCSKSSPTDIAKDVPPGGGRVSKQDPDPDDDYQNFG